MRLSDQGLRSGVYDKSNQLFANLPFPALLYGKTSRLAQITCDSGRPVHAFRLRSTTHPLPARVRLRRHAAVRGHIEGPPLRKRDGARDTTPGATVCAQFVHKYRSARGFRQAFRLSLPVTNGSRSARSGTSGSKGNPVQIRNYPRSCKSPHKAAHPQMPLLQRSMGRRAVRDESEDLPGVATVAFG